MIAQRIKWIKYVPILLKKELLLNKPAKWLNALQGLRNEKE